VIFSAIFAPFGERTKSKESRITTNDLLISL